MGRAAPQEAFEGAAGFRKMVVGVRENADVHLGEARRAKGAWQARKLDLFGRAARAIVPRFMDRNAFFMELARGANPLAFKPEHEPRVDRLRRRLGNLEGKRVFEPGCGAGPLTARLAHWVGRSGRVLALDSCLEMAKLCAESVGGYGNVEIEVGKAEDAGLETAAWDLILCFRFYPHLEKPREFLGKCGKWLAPGGELVVANLEGSAALNEMHSRLRGVHGDEMPTAGKLRGMMEAAGWKVEEAIDEPDEYFLRARPDR